jgi:hypothetical protein
VSDFWWGFMAGQAAALMIGVAALIIVAARSSGRILPW